MDPMDDLLLMIVSYNMVNDLHGSIMFLWLLLLEAYYTAQRGPVWAS